MSKVTTRKSNVSLKSGTSVESEHHTCQTLQSSGFGASRNKKCGAVTDRNRKKAPKTAQTSDTKPREENVRWVSPYPVKNSPQRGDKSNSASLYPDGSTTFSISALDFTTTTPMPVTIATIDRTNILCKNFASLLFT